MDFESEPKIFQNLSVFTVDDSVPSFFFSNVEVIGMKEKNLTVSSDFFYLSS